MIMDKVQLKKQLLDAGLAEDLVDAKLATLKDDQLADLDGIPAAKLLKELDIEEPGDDESDEEDGEEPTFFVLDPEVLKDFRTIVKEEIALALDGLELEVPEPVEKENPVLKEIQETMAALAEAVEALTQKDDERLSQIVKNMPRQAKFRIQRYKGSKAADEEEEPEDGEDEEEGEKMPYKAKGKKKVMKEADDADPAEGVVYGANGRTFSSLTSALLDAE
jgi:hypothetical protein